MSDTFFQIELGEDDFMHKVHPIHTCLTLLGIGILALSTGCTITPPVQELSNARQTLQAATEAKADTYSPGQMTEARQMLQQATGALETGDYNRAREYAVSAQRLAIKAHHQAVSQQQPQPNANF